MNARRHIGLFLQNSMLDTSFIKSFRRSRSTKDVRLIVTACVFMLVLANVFFLNIFVFINQSHVQYSFRTEENENYLHKADVYSRDSSKGLSDELLSNSVSFNSVYYKQRLGHGQSRKLMGERDTIDIKFVDTIFEEEFHFSDDWLRSAVHQADGQLLTCDDLEKIRNVTYLSRGWTKVVHKGVYKDRHVAIKTVDVNGHDVTSCLTDGHGVAECYAKAAKKIVKEILLLSSLQNENVVKVLGFCISPKLYEGHEISSVALITELGVPIDQIMLFQMSWENRLRITLDISRLVHYLSHSPLGSIALNDFRLSQFVLVDGTLKLTDVDDAGLAEPPCSLKDVCDFKFENISKRFMCVQGRCQGHNEYLNMYKTGKDLVRLLLPYGSPRTLKPFIKEVMNSTHALLYSSGQLLDAVQHVVDSYRTGAYLSHGRNSTGNEKYVMHSRSDLPGEFDYRCGLSLSGDGCTVSVFDLREAQDVCDSEESCRGFVWTQSKTWAGRTIIHLKNGFNFTTENQNTDLYLKHL
ncbi:extracellular tyrosine-protein kinase PKDCC-like [Biomphalaria glabrata]|uniref:Extracellular tyrosine-protein kinase PKDCC-like n=1 Tax=Biomphalaria glabrata TaxID=6526 RepID=A0A9U8DV62_BIOGL|nr:extracellular tyrosine-protein kinase PKDCC-like [Biomphalaria glabrata]XP_055878399.1 extracellular tyrosine-protein kinase PKDCC-like [Biomphalaria glabrata]